MMQSQEGRGRECRCYKKKRIKPCGGETGKSIPQIRQILPPPQPQLDAGTPWLWYGQPPCFMRSQGKFRADNAGQACSSRPLCYQSSDGSKCVFIAGNNNKAKLVVSSCCCFFLLLTGLSCLPWLRKTENVETFMCGVSIQAALSVGGVDTEPIWPFHGDSAGFNYPQLCLISLPSWALCPSVLCKYATFTAESRWGTDMNTHTHTHTARWCRLTCKPHRLSTQGSIGTDWNTWTPV